MSRPRRAVCLQGNTIGVWAECLPLRCVLTREGLANFTARGFLICILREFDEPPQQ